MLAGAFFSGDVERGGDLDAVVHQSRGLNETHDGSLWYTILC